MFTITTTHSTGPVKHSLDGQREDTDPQIHREEGLPLRHNSFISEVKERFHFQHERSMVKQDRHKQCKTTVKTASSLNMLRMHFNVLRLVYSVLAKTENDNLVSSQCQIGLFLSDTGVTCQGLFCMRWWVIHVRHCGCHVHTSDMRESAILLPKPLVAFYLRLFFLIWWIPFFLKKSLLNLLPYCFWFMFWYLATRYLRS